MKINLLPFIIVLLLIPTLFGGSNSYAQNKLLVSERFPETKYNRVVGEVYFNDYMQIKGNAFISEDWSTGDVYLKDGYTIKNINFKLDAYEHRLLVYQEYLKRIVLLDKRLINSFSITENGKERKFKLVHYTDTRVNSDNGSFMEVLLNGNILLYKYYSRDVVPLRASEGILLDEFTEETDYYIVENGVYSHIRISKATLLKRYPQFKDEMKQYIRKQKLHVKKESDFVIALEYLSQLTELTTPGKLN